MNLPPSELNKLFNKRLETAKGRAKLSAAFKSYVRDVLRQNSGHLSILVKNLKCAPNEESLCQAFDRAMDDPKLRDGLYRLVLPHWR